METKEEINHLVEQLKNDREYRETWASNIAVSFKDNYYKYKKETGRDTMFKEDVHIIANRSANSFLELICDEIKYPEGR